MRKKLLSMFIVLVLTGLGLTSVQIELLQPIIDRFIPSAEASTFKSNVDWEVIPFSFKNPNWYNSEGEVLHASYRLSSRHHACDSCHNLPNYKAKILNDKYVV